MKRAASHFLNLDLELNSRSDLSPLAKHLKRTSAILYNGPSGNGFRLCAEPIVGGRFCTSPRICTTFFLDALKALPPRLAALLSSCSSRFFDYGFEGGLQSKPLYVTLPASHLARIARLGAQVRVTVYSHRVPEA